MNDHFFLSTTDIPFSEIAEVISSDARFDASHTEQGVTVMSPEGRLVMSVLRIENEELSSAERRMFQERDIRACFCLSHRSSEVEEVLLPLTRALLQRLGGWIGGDEDGFEPILELNELESLRAAGAI